MKNDKHEKGKENGKERPKPENLKKAPVIVTNPESLNDKESSKYSPTYFIIGALILLLGSLLITRIPPQKDQREENKDKIKIKRLISPEGTATLVRIKTLDKAFKEEGEYKVVLHCKPSTETKEYMDAIEKEILEYKEKKEKELGEELPLAGFPWEIIKKSQEEQIAKIDDFFPKEETNQKKEEIKQDSTTDHKPSEMGIAQKEEKVTPTGTLEEIKEVEATPSPIQTPKKDTEPTTKIDDQVIEFKFRETGSFKSKGKVVRTRIMVFDKEGKEIKGIVPSGSKMKVAADIVPYYNPERGIGVTLRLKAIQVSDLAETTRTSIAEEFGFSVEQWGENTKEKKEIVQDKKDERDQKPKKKEKYQKNQRTEGKKSKKEDIN